MEWLSVSEAAGKLGVSERQVRRLAGKDLPARQVGGRWLISAEAVRRRSRAERLSGRPLSSHMAWLVLRALDCVLEDDQSAEFGDELDRRVRHHLRALLADAPPSEHWNQWLRHRAEETRVWVHPGVLQQLATDPRVRPTRAPVPTAAGAELTGDRHRRFYVDVSEFISLLKDYRATPDENGNVLLMVVPSHASDEALGQPGQPASSAATLVDLLSSPDAREHHHAATVLDEAREELLATTGSPRSTE